MVRSTAFQIPILVTAAVILAAGCAPREIVQSDRYEDLLTLFEEWRAFEHPNFVNGVPDYSASAMSEQHRELAHYQNRLAVFLSAALSVGAVSSALSNWRMQPGSIPAGALVIPILVSLPSLVAATIAGAWVYREPEGIHSPRGWERVPCPPCAVTWGGRRVTRLARVPYLADMPCRAPSGRQSRSRHSPARPTAIVRRRAAARPGTRCRSR